ncbi:MAG: type II toxin-antitoxin system RelE/ParE family toxin [Flammeovirgaceae bacterium]|nr:type II toxin-antitoxin system RelE/ParE family toxin [Flammeovirgaceae bacterium]
MKKRKVIWDDEAKRSLRSIYDYIASRESEREKVVREISRQVKTLSAHSEKFAIEPNFSKMDGNFRFKVVGAIK